MHEKYQLNVNLKCNINNIFQRAVWHSVDNMSDSHNDRAIYKKDYDNVVHLIDSFAMLCCPKTREEFEDNCKKEFKHDYKKNNKILTDTIDYNNLVIPYDIYNKWCTIKYMRTALNIDDQMLEKASLLTGIKEKTSFRWSTFRASICAT